MHIKVDEDLPRAVTALLVQAGYTETRSVTDQRMGGWTDAALWEAVQRESRCLVTADKDSLTCVRIRLASTPECCFCAPMLTAFSR